MELLLGSQARPTQLVAPAGFGTTTVVPKPAGATSCVGLAWDPSNNSIYQAAGGTIFHFTLTGGAVTGNPASFAPPAGCVVSGLSVVGGVLLVTCDGSATGRRLDKSTDRKST